MCFVNETQRRPVLIFDAEAFDAAVEGLGYDTKAAKADFLGVSRAAYSKITCGLNQPSPNFIAAVMLRFGPSTLGRFVKAELR